MSGIRIECYVDEWGMPEMVIDRHRGALMNQAQIDTYNAIVAAVNSARNSLIMLQRAQDSAAAQRAMQEKAS